MQYDMFKLGEKSKELCIIIMPFDKYKYICIHMGLKSLIILLNKSWNKSSEVLKMLKYILMTTTSFPTTGKSTLPH